jgi:hypothetical protein
MRFKTLLLGSATAFAFVGGAAQAADLSVAEPVDYVRVCDAFGAGYWYIPGTDTCIRIGGEVEFRVYFHEDKQVSDPDADETDDEHTGSWEFQTSFDLDFTTKSMTDWGPLTTYLNLTGTSNEGSGSGDDGGDGLLVEADEYFLSLGPVLLGHTGSAFDGGAAYTWNAGDIAMQDLGDQKVDQVQLSWAISGFGLVLALEDPRDGWGSSETNDFPDLVAAISASGTGWDANAAFLYSDQVADSFWAVRGDLEFDVWGDSLLLSALFADDGSGAGGSDRGLVVTDGWAAVVSYKHNWSSTLYSAASFQYGDDNDAGDGYIVAFTTAFQPAEGLWVGADVQYSDGALYGTDGDWWLTLFAERKFGG